MLDSPLLRGEELRFSETGVREMVRRVWEFAEIVPGNDADLWRNGIEVEDRMIAAQRLDLQVLAAREIADALRQGDTVGIMACYDIKAQKLLDACRELDIAVPEEVAVIGVDNDELLARYRWTQEGEKEWDVSLLHEEAD